MINAEMALVNTFLEIRRAISLQKFGFHDIHEPTDWLQAHVFTYALCHPPKLWNRNTVCFAISNTKPCHAFKGRGI